MRTINEAVTNNHCLPEPAAEAFLNAPTEESFVSLFRILTPQLVAFFRARGCEEVAEDLAQDVMLTVYRKAGDVRDRTLFRAWVFTIARNALSRHWGQRSRTVETVELAEVSERFVASHNQSAGPPAFEFHRWMAFLEAQEGEALTLRFVGECAYHEIAAAQAIPIGTAQWRVFNAKKKLAPLLRRIEINTARMAA
jgi:RNA polymerase sigma-70 factor (ECF subfamily)